MNTTELKALAEKATPGPWTAKKTPGAGLSVHADVGKALGPRYSSDCPIYHLGNDYCTMAISYELWTQFPRAEWEAMQEANARLIAAANPAAILELIAQLEDAQGEIRALRATEQNLRERVKALEEVAAALLPFADDASAINGYGYYRPKNPHDFHPDAESCTEDEIAAHKAACEAWDAGTYKDNYGDGWVSPNVHILRAPWGIGSYTDEVPEIAAICNRARALLEQKP